MRTGLLAVLIAAASFAGGAVVNGNGLNWARAALQGRSGADDTAVLAGRDLVGARNDHPPDASGSAPTAPEPPSVARSEGPTTTAPPVTPTRPDPAPEPAPATGQAVEAPQVEAPRPPVAEPGLPALEAPNGPKAEGGELARPADPDRPAEGPSTPAPGGLPAVPEAARDGHVAAVGPKAVPSWADLRGRMRELGVARYWIEGEPDGRSRFRCVIPLAGRRAVGQQFEAEGDDALRAADAALRRVALWRASGGP